jgi:hypothetical protein
MGTVSQNIFPYDSLDKYSEALVQCPICLYYFKVNPQTDSMKYRILSRNQIHFLTHHSFNDSSHTIILEFINFSFSKIIDFRDSDQTDNTFAPFPLLHLVSISEYTTFRNRVLELESNNNSLISDFKTKLDRLESVYKQKDSDFKTLEADFFNLTTLKESLESDKAKLLEELEFFKNSENSQIKESLDKITELEKQLSSRQENTHPSDSKLLGLLEQERLQKRNAIREKKEFQFKTSELEKKIAIIEQKFSFEQDLKAKTLIELQNFKDQSEHTLTLDYEKKISDLTLSLADKDEEIALLKQDLESSSKKSRETKSDKKFREEIAELFLQVQNRFNELQYDIMLSFYHTEHLDPQIRNAFEKFFSQLVSRATSIGQQLTTDQSFGLFKEQFTLNPRLKFSEDQQQASFQLQALNIVLSDLCLYIFAIIKSVKASLEDDTYKIVPDDAEILSLLTTSIENDKIKFFIPEKFKDVISNLGPSLRIFRPSSHLYKNSVLVITRDNDSTIYNNSYQLLTFQLHSNDNDLIVEIDNFYSKSDSFQLTTLNEGFFIIQRTNFFSELSFFKNFLTLLKDNFQFSNN